MRTDRETVFFYDFKFEKYTTSNAAGEPGVSSSVKRVIVWRTMFVFSNVVCTRLRIRGNRIERFFKIFFSPADIGFPKPRHHRP